MEQIIKIAGVEMYEHEAREWYESGEKYLITFSRITEIILDEKTGKFKGKTLYQYKPKYGIGLTRRGRHYRYNEQEARKYINDLKSREA